MKKIYSILASITLLVAVLIPVQSVSAYPGGGAEGRTFSYWNNTNTLIETTSLITDNDEVTFYNVTSPNRLNIGVHGYPVTSIRLKSSAAMQVAMYEGGTEKLLKTLTGDGSVVQVSPALSKISGIALLPTTSSVKVYEFDYTYADPDAPTNLTGVASDSVVTLNWTASINNGSVYNVYMDGVLVNSTPIKETYFTVPNVQNGVEHTFYVTSLNPVKVESPHSNEVKTIFNVPGRAILTITMTNGLEKEYDLAMAELKSFIAWYDAKDTGTGPSKYAFTKSWNKGPFKARTEYVIFDKILTFDVDEYTTAE